MVDKILYEGDDVVVRLPWDQLVMEGHSAAFCECGYVLHIETPAIKNWYTIKCPKCGFVIQLYCGKEGKHLDMAMVRSCL